ncbi:MAG TPA: phosphohistidine phosphatase SixA [Opitutaceae bacterium]
MLLYLIRHAEAADIVPDEARPLTAHGREQVASIARFLQRSRAFRPAAVWHSPLVRARETAQLLMKELSLATPLREVPGITPDDDPREIVPALINHPAPLALVGHEPHLSALASQLVTGATYPAVFAMKKGAVLALERGPGTRWVVRWHVEPDLFA